MRYPLYVACAPGEAETAVGAGRAAELLALYELPLRKVDVALDRVLRGSFVVVNDEWPQGRTWTLDTYDSVWAKDDEIETSFGDFLHQLHADGAFFVDREGALREEWTGALSGDHADSAVRRQALNLPIQRFRP
ncbi:hypothetical protein [Embleya sp. NPDC005575]|uniref:hypothetical protein n=1 Tax=Embleya sp. NPDC005575 TaxID=3156892 RepID=UPI0033AED888